MQYCHSCSTMTDLAWQVNIVCDGSSTVWDHWCLFFPTLPAAFVVPSSSPKDTLQRKSFLVSSRLIYLVPATRLYVVFSHRVLTSRNGRQPIEMARAHIDLTASGAVRRYRDNLCLELRFSFNHSCLLRTTLSMYVACLYSNSFKDIFNWLTY